MLTLLRDRYDIEAYDRMAGYLAPYGSAEAAKSRMIPITKVEDLIAKAS